MKRIALLLSIFLLSTQVFADGIKFHQGDWASALAEAKAQDKLIFMDCYTTWCGPCKMMSRDVFPNEKVGEFFNKNFINVKMDMEKGEGRNLAREYRVSAYPTLLFVDGDGKVVHTDKGAKPVDRFLVLGKTALKKFDKSIEYAQQYDSGERKPDFLLKFAYALRRANKPYAKVLNEYLDTQTDFKSEENLNALFELTERVDSRAFGLMMEHKSGILALDKYDEVDFEQKVLAAANTTVDASLEFKSEMLLNDAKTAVKKYAKSSYPKFAVKADMTFNANNKDEKKFFKATDKYVKKFAKNNAQELNHAASSVFLVCENDKYLGKAEKWSKKAIENGGLPEYYFTYASLLMKQGKNAEALKAAKEGKNAAVQSKQPTAMFDGLIQKLTP